MALQTAISKAVCYKIKNEQLWEKAVHFLLVATNWFYASLPTVFFVPLPIFYYIAAETKYPTYENQNYSDSFGLRLSRMC